MKRSFILLALPLLPVVVFSGCSAPLPHHPVADGAVRNVENHAKQILLSAWSSGIEFPKRFHVVPAMEKPVETPLPSEKPRPADTPFPYESPFWPDVRSYVENGLEYLGYTPGDADPGELEVTVNFYNRPGFRNTTVLILTATAGGRFCWAVQTQCDWKKPDDLRNVLPGLVAAAVAHVGEEIPRTTCNTAARPELLDAIYGKSISPR